MLWRTHTFLSPANPHGSRRRSCNAARVWQSLASCFTANPRATRPHFVAPVVYVDVVQREDRPLQFKHAKLPLKASVLTFEKCWQLHPCEAAFTWQVLCPKAVTCRHGHCGFRRVCDAAKGVDANAQSVDVFGGSRLRASNSQRWVRRARMTAAIRWLTWAGASAFGAKPVTYMAASRSGHPVPLDAHLLAVVARLNQGGAAPLLTHR